MAKKQTKADLQKEIEQLKDQLVLKDKEISELKIKISFYESLPQNICNQVGAGIGWWVNQVTGQGQK
jgi:hypothetical protein